MSEVNRQSDSVTFLIHGIWMHGVLMAVLAGMLKARGFRTRCLSYPFLSNTPAQNAELLARKIQQEHAARVNLIGHSLGGIVVLHLLNQYPALAVDKVVLIGSPVNGSSVAKHVHETPLLKYFLGKSVVDGLLGGAPAYRIERPLGIIIGKGRWGVTSLLYPSGKDSDGVVREHETELAGTTDKISLPLSHSTMLFSKQCANQVAHFLRFGSFE